jgi:drug/metabolite transporter (DMT)-like permease
MDPGKLIASPGVRVASALLVIVSVAALGFQPIVAAVTGLLAFLGLIMSFRSSYQAWMRMAERLQTVVTTILFGACYLLVVPLFAAFVRMSDPLRLRRPKNESSWVGTRQEARDARSYQRMG